MKTKKLVAGLVSAMMLASISMSATVSAAGSFNVSISNAKAAAGEDFSLTLDLADIPETGINGCEFGISYDPTLVTINDVELGSLAKDISGVELEEPPYEKNIEENVIDFMYAIGLTDATYCMTGAGTLLNIKGTVKADAPAGSEAIFKVVNVNRPVKPGSSSMNGDIMFGYMASDEKITKYTPEFTDGVLTITDGTSGPTEPTEIQPTLPEVTENLPDGTKYGDVNLDDKINISDAVALSKFLIDSEANPLGKGDEKTALEAKANADCVRDNALNGLDATVIVNYSAMLTDASALGKK